MKRSHKNVIASVAMAAGALFGATRAEAAIGWEITYQGELKDGGAPLNGTADLSFKLFDALNNQVGATVLKDDAIVTDGVFTAQVDFTNGGVIAGVFDGNERFIEVTVNGTTLSPKQRCAPAPHAAIASYLVYPHAARCVVDGSAYYLWNDANSPATIAIHGEMSSPDTGGVAIFGHASSPTSLNTTGVLGRSEAANGIGVIGDATHTVGNVTGVYGSVASPAGNGVFGIANSPTGATRGVYGKVLSNSGHAGYFEGRGYFSDPVGIGTTNPGYSLHVNGLGSTILGESSDRLGTKLSLENTDTGGQLWAMKSTGSADSEGAGKFKIGTAGSQNRLCLTDNFVGIGRSTAIGAADFAIESDAFGTNYGGMYINTPNAVGKPFYGYASGGSAQAWTYYNGTTASWHLNLGGVDRLLVDATGEVGIGTSGPAFLLHVNGSAGKPGGGSWSNSSDRRLKKDIEDLDGSLEKLMALRGVTYEYKDAAKIHELPGRQTGFIAQEVEKVFPQWVDEGKDGFKRVTFRGFEALTVEALRELSAQKDARIAEQDERIDALESELAALRTMVETIAMQSAASGAVRPAVEWTPAARAAH